MDGIYAALHGNIQDAFNQAGVEIMSPHYTSLRDGNTVTIPESHRPPGYRPPAFRVTIAPRARHRCRRSRASHVGHMPGQLLLSRSAARPDAPGGDPP